MASIDEIVTVFNMLRANYFYAMRDMAASQISDLQLLWCELLRDIDGPVLKASALQHVSESKWFPSVAEIRKLAAMLVTPNRKTPIEAWGDVKRQIKLAGYYRLPQFDDEITAGVVADMGWQSLCLSENEAADRARFIQGYEDAIKNEHARTVELPQVRDIRMQIQETARRLQIGGKR